MESGHQGTRQRSGVRALAVLLVFATGILPTVAPRAEDRSSMITEQARDAVLAMGKTLSAGQFSFRNMTIREYTDPNGQPLHIFQHGSVTVRRPDRVRADVTGDDGAINLAYNGNTLVVYEVGLKKSASLPVTGDLSAMLKAADARLGLDFPLADFITNSPGQAFLSGVTSGTEINTVSIDGTPCSHLLFAQPPGIELELWLEKGEHAVPRRLIVTYRSLPGEPRFVAEMSDWNFAVHPSDAEFTLSLPSDVEQVSIAQEEPK
jgi:hypothetical protein